MADMKPQGTQQYAIESGYESGDANVKAVVSGLAIILVSTVIVMAAMYGMFNVMHAQFLSKDTKIADALGTRIVPPEPRLLPSPYTDEQPESVKQYIAEGKDTKWATEDGLPWDKRNSEIEIQYDEANAYGKYKLKEKDLTVKGVPEKTEDRVRIPIADAMKIMSGSDKPGTPAIMTWQHDNPISMTGKDGKSMIFDPAKKHTDETIFDKRAYWETQDEKFTSDSTGGTILNGNDLSR